MELLMTLMKINLLMQADLYETLGIESNVVDTGLLKEAITSGNLWALRRKMHGACSEEKDNEVVAQVHDVMSMWQHIENSYKQLSQDDQARVAEEASRFGRQPEFTGFAGNDEAQHLSVALFLINQLGLYGLFKGRDLNCHSPSVAMQHLPMLIAYRRMRPTLISEPMSVDQLIEVLTAQHFLAVERGQAA